MFVSLAVRPRQSSVPSISHCLLCCGVKVHAPEEGKLCRVQKLDILRNFLLAQSLLGKRYVKGKDLAWKHRGLMACAVPACSMRP